MKNNLIRVAAAVALIVGTGIVHGGWTNRWRPAPMLTELAGRLRALPMEVGPWTATAREIPDRELTMAGAAGYISRNYRNTSTGATVSVLMLCGLPGDMATHTPEACYPGAGFVLGEPESYPWAAAGGDTQAPAVQFRTSLATKGGATPSKLRLFWTWHTSKGWAAPEDARWAYASEPFLTKLYVVRETGGQAVTPKDDPTNDFLKDFLPQLDRHVFAPPGGADPGLPSGH